MISIYKSIARGLWLKADFNAESYNEDLKFKIKPLSFTKINIKEEIDEPANLKQITIDSNVWLFKFEIVNLCRKNLEPYQLEETLILVDAENYQYTPVDDGHLNLWSNYANTSGLRRFDDSDLPPKVKKQGVFAFELPEACSELTIDVDEGSLVEEDGTTVQSETGDDVSIPFPELINYSMDGEERHYPDDHDLEEYDRYMQLEDPK